MQHPLFLTGMMGCGKTTVGRALADAQGVPLVDLDDRIERLFGATVPELVAAQGEPGLREAEARALQSLVAEPGFCGRGVVVATGGGTVLHVGNRQAMDRVGRRVYLEVSIDELVRRLWPLVEADPEARPLLHGGPPGSGLVRLRERVTELLAARGPVYRAGALVVDAHGEPAVVAARVARAAADDANEGSSADPCDPALALGAMGSEAV